MTGILCIIVILGIIPFLLGIPWMCSFEKSNSYSYAYSIGYFIQFTIFQIVSFPIVLLRGSFQTIILFYSVILIVMCLISFKYLLKNYGKIKERRRNKFRVSFFEGVYIIAILSVIGIQLVRGITYDISYMANDDGVYIVTAEQALEGQGLGTIHWTFGESMPLNVHYSISAWLFYPAFVSFYSGIPIVTIVHTIFYDQLIVLCYSVCWYMSGELFSKRENRLVFLLLIALFYWFGYHSHYSLTFRLLGPNYQGKAVLAVTLTPLILTMLLKILFKPFMWKYFFILLALSVASCGLTLWGAGTIVIIVSLPIFISMVFKNKQIKNLLYILAVIIYPIICSSLYFFSKYAV